MKAFTENSADSKAVLLRAGEGEASENGSGAAQSRRLQAGDLQGCKWIALDKEKPDMVAAYGCSGGLRLRRMRPLARYAVGHSMLRAVHRGNVGERSGDSSRRGTFREGCAK